MTRFSIGPWLVEPPINRLSCDSHVIQLEPKVMDVLVRLAEKPGGVLSKEELLSSVWRGTFVSEDVLTRAVSQLRKMLEDDARQPRFIETVSRKGYRLVMPVRQTEETASEKPELTGPTRSDRDAPLGAYSSSRVLYLLAFLVVVVLGAIWLFRRSSRPSPPVAHATLAVLPFVNLSADPAEEYFSDGMTEEMIATLSRAGNQGLAVIARTSAMRYKNSGKDIEQIGDELKADYILESSVRHSGGQVRVTAQLIQVRGQTHLWAESYNSELKDVLSVQEHISQAVAQAIRLELSERHVIPRTVDPTAYQLYLKGRYFLDRPRTPEALRKALGYFQEATQHDPGFARAWANSALAYELLEYVGAMSPRETHPDALAAAGRAVELDPSSAEGHLALAYIHEHYEWSWRAADHELARAIELDPNYEMARQWLSYGRLCRGDTESALTEMRRAFTLDPLSPRVNITFAERLDRAGRHEEAIRQLQEAVDIEPGNSAPHFELARLYINQGAFEKVAKEELRALELDHNLEAANLLSVTWKQRGPQAAYEKVETHLVYEELRDLNTRARHREYVSPGGYIWAYARLQDRENTLLWLQRALDEHASILLELRNSAFDFLRAAPRFQQLVAAVNIPGPEDTASY